MNKLPELVKTIDRLQEELRQMAINETNARAELERLAEDDSITDAEREQAGLTCQFRLSNIPLRRKKVSADLARARAELAAAFGPERRRAMEAVKAARAAKHTEICAALAPFYAAAPDSRPVRRAVDGLPIPALEQFRKHVARLSVETDPSVPIENRVRAFLTGAQAVGRALGWPKVPTL